MFTCLEVPAGKKLKSAFCLPLLIKHDLPENTKNSEKQAFIVFFGLDLNKFFSIVHD
jgi:hypothetical protein